MRKGTFRLLFLFIGITSVSLADQPIMNMMPRWDGGYGVQVLAETLHRSDLKQGKDVVAEGHSEDIRQLHLQGVYTWDRSIRLTFKLPYVTDARREVPGEGGTKTVERDSGWGDLTLALPLKNYFNLDQRSGNWSLTPQVRVPLGKKDSGYSAAKRVWGSGLSLGYETETYHWFFATGVTGWIFESPEPAEWSTSIDLGWNAQDDLQVLWESDFKWNDEGAFTLAAGPALYWRYSDRIHTRIEWKHDFVSQVSRNRQKYGNGDRLSLGVGFVY
jgi:hypothetical protein